MIVISFKLYEISSEIIHLTVKNMVKSNYVKINPMDTFEINFSFFSDNSKETTNAKNGTMTKNCKYQFMIINYL